MIAIIDLIDNILTITLPDDREYLINKHEPSLQIWLSSPIGTTNYFTLDETSDKWLDKTGKEIYAIIEEELKPSYK